MHHQTVLWSATKRTHNLSKYHHQYLNKYTNKYLKKYLHKIASATWMS